MRNTQNEREERYFSASIPIACLAVTFWPAIGGGVWGRVKL